MNVLFIDYVNDQYIIENKYCLWLYDIVIILC